MNLSQRYKQATKEARWALGLAILYVIGLCLSTKKLVWADRVSVVV